MVATLTSSSPTFYHSHKDFHLSRSGFLPITEEKEDESISPPIVDELKTKLFVSSKALQQYISSTMLKPKQAQLGGQRRVSSASTSSSRSGFDGGAPLQTPTVSSVGMLASERENMQTPRPRNKDSPTSARTRGDLPSHPAALQNHGKESSDATLGPVQARDQDEEGIRFSTDYSSNSMGRLSASSSGHGIRQSMSESGEGLSSSSGRKSRKKMVAPPELLVIVRPPPSKQVNPLNLQIQLVIPQVQSNTTTSRASMESSRDDAPITASASSGSNGSTVGSNTVNALTAPLTPTASRKLQRTSSMTSSRSARSDVSSGGYSNSSSTSANRRVTPLYNLNFHSITATTVTDAGTDEKVAKFGKKALDIDGFGQLEPHELLLGVNDLTSLMSKQRSANKDTTAGTAVSNNSGSDFTSPDGLSVASHNQGTDITKATSRMSDAGALITDEEPPTSFDAMSPEAKNPSEGGILGGKFLSKFKRFSMGTGGNFAGGKLGSIGSPSIRSGSTAQESIISTGPTSLLAKMTSAAVNKVKDSGEMADDPSEATSVRDFNTNPYSLGQALGLDIPQLIAGGGLRSDGRKTEGYYWNVKRWNRRSAQDYDEEEVRDRRLEVAGNNPILNSVWKRFNIVNRMGGQEIHPPCSEVPVRFEWSRNFERRKASVVSSGHVKAATENSSRSRPAFSRPSMDARAANAEATSDSVEVFRSNLRPPKGGQTSRPSSVHSSGSARYRGSMDAGSQGGSAENYEDSDPEDSETTWSCHLVLGPTTRIPIGSLSPTPHHPKLIGQLSIPFPLPDLSQSGLGADGAGLTREELKDIINVTCLFVVIREGFGGLIKKKRTLSNR